MPSSSRQDSLDVPSIKQHAAASRLAGWLRSSVGYLAAPLIDAPLFKEGRALPGRPTLLWALGHPPKQKQNFNQTSSLNARVCARSMQHTAAKARCGRLTHEPTMGWTD